MGYFKKLDLRLQELAFQGESKPDQKRFYVNAELPVEFADEGAWRSYEIQSEGDGVGELFCEAYVSETDQDGEELDFYPLLTATNEILGAAIIVFETITGEKLCDNEDGEGGCASNGRGATEKEYEENHGTCSKCANLIKGV